MDDYLELCTIGDLLVRGRTHAPDRDAVVFPHTRLSYRELEEHAVTVGRALWSEGVRRGDRVALFMPNCAEFLESMFGALFLGAVVVPVNARFRARELAHVLADAQPRALLTADSAGSAGRTDLVAEAYRQLSDARPPTTVGLSATAGHHSFLSWKQFCSRSATTTPDEVDRRRHAVAVRDIAMMFYTSGTTSAPKGCTLSHEALIRTGINTRHRLGYRDGERVFAPCPMFHTASTQPTLAALHACGTVVTMNHFEPDRALKLIDSEQVTAMFAAFPALTEGMLNSPDYGPDSFKRVRTAFNVAPGAALRSMQRRMPHTTVVDAYGMTEFGGSVVMVRPEDGDEARLNTQGPPFPGIDVAVQDEQGKPLGPGERGEIVVRGPSRFAEYHHDTAKTRATIDDDGWFHTGDLGTVDEHGRLHFLGRLKEMLKVGGENVAAIEIASHLQELPAVNVAHVVGIPDPKYGEVPAAFLELRPGATLTEQQVIGHCTEGLARFKVPRYVRFVTEWPMSSTKVQTAKLREQLEHELNL